MNKTLRLLLIADIFSVTGFGLIDPIVSIFVADRIDGGTIAAAGSASSIYYAVKSCVQLPFSRYIDRNHEQRARWLIVAGLIMTAVPFVYALVKSVPMFYAAQVLYGVGSGLSYPTWLSLWSSNLDKGQESFEWTMHSTLTCLGYAAAGALGAWAADSFGFAPTFTGVGLLSLLGTSILFSLVITQPARKPASVPLELSAATAFPSLFDEPPPIAEGYFQPAVAIGAQSHSR